MRETVDARQLLHILNLQLAASGVPESCRFSEPICRLRTPDGTGCNWSRFVTMSADGQGPYGHLDAAEQVLLSVSRRYNLAG